jgi:hypothetical protein
MQELLLLSDVSELLSTRKDRARAIIDEAIKKGAIVKRRVGLYRAVVASDIPVLQAINDSRSRRPRRKTS